MAVFIALLRGINVGGHHKVLMKDLRVLLEQLGLQNVQTYIQSGNVVFESQSRSTTKLAKILAKELELSFGFAIPVVVRTQEELVKVFRSNPFLGLKTNDPKLLHVGFLSRKPTAAKVKSLELPETNDSLKVVGSELFLHCPDGVARSKLTMAFFEKGLDVTCTFRNWKTVQKLVELSSQN